jgi:uncharacterized protein YegL
MAVRRLPVYLVIDTSGYMGGDPIEQVRRGVALLVSWVRTDPMAAETVWLSVITYGRTARQTVPLTRLPDFTAPELHVAPDDTAVLGAALDLLSQCVEREAVKTTPDAEGDFTPVILLMTNGRATDAWEATADEIKNKRWTIVACTAGPAADGSLLRRIAGSVVKLSDSRPGFLGGDWRDPCGSITGSGVVRSVSADLPLPPPPDAISIV